MKKLVLFLVAFVSTCIIVNGQTPGYLWSKSIGASLKDGACDVIVDSAGNVFTVGYYRGVVDFDPGPAVFNMTASVTDGAFFLTKMNAAGDFVWAKSWTKGFYNSPFTLNLDQDQNIYVTGPFSNTIDFDPGTAVVMESAVYPIKYFVLKLDNNGNFVWVKTLGRVNNSPQVYSSIDATGNIYVGGFFSDSCDFDPGPGNYVMDAALARDLFLVKLDPTGNFVWAIQTTGTIYTWVNGMDTDPSGNVYMTGSFSGTTDFDPGPGTASLTASAAFNSEDIYILKYTPAGALGWVAQIGSAITAYDRPAAIDVDALGNVYSTGFFYSTVDFDPGPGTFIISNANSYILKLDSAGNFISAIGINNNGGTIYPGSIAVDANSKIYFSGTFTGTTDIDPGSGVYNLTADSMGTGIFAAALDSAGNLIWADATGGHAHTGTQYNAAPSIFADQSNNIYLCGAFEDPKISFGADTLFNASPGTLDITDAFITKIEFTTTGLHELSELNQSTLSVYPNPSSGIINLHSTAPLTSLDIFNATGQLISNQSIPSQTELTIDLTKSNSGIYFFVGQDQNGNVYSEKVVVSGKF